MSDSLPELPSDDGIVARGELKLPLRPALREFKPWHLPRKQLVRREQWASKVEALIGDLPPGQTIQYMGLPGEDLLDLEVIAKVCDARKRQFRYLGFDDAEAVDDKTPRELGESIVHGIGNVSEGSTILQHRFAEVTMANSPANRALKDFGPLDIVNLDLCGAFSSQEPMGHMHNAVAHLLEHQRNKRTEPWLMFLTLRSEANRMLPNELNVYSNLLYENCKGSAVFAEQLAAVGGWPETQAVTSSTEIVPAMTRCSWRCGRLVALGIGKWMVNLLKKHTPWRVSLLSVWGYRAGLVAGDGASNAKGPPNLLSVVYRFDRVKEGVSDDHGLARSFGASRDVAMDLLRHERELAEKMARCVAKYSLDLDCHLQSVDGLAAELEEEARKLLIVRSYDATAYVNFARRAAAVSCEPLATVNVSKD